MSHAVPRRPALTWLALAAGRPPPQSCRLNRKPRTPTTKDDFSQLGCLVLTAEAHLAGHARRKFVKNEATQEATEFPEDPARERLFFKGRVARKEAPHPTTKRVP